MPKTSPPSDEELYSMPPWEFEETGGFLYVVDGKGRMTELGPTEEACEKMVAWLTGRDFGE
jgi:hypothetical protein